MEIRLKPLLKGAASFVVPSLRTVHGKLDKMSAADAEFCYSLFLRHYSYVAPYFENGIPKVVAELGPGSSLGMGLCALLLGADTYYALDIVDHTDPVRNLRVLDELVKMISERRPVPRHETTFPEPARWNFPSQFAMPSRERLNAIRDDVGKKTKRFIRPVVPWTSTEIPEGTVTWLWSHSVMEHVDDVERTWKSCGTWLARNGVMTHEIDYQSHRLTKHWNGHWSTSDLCWRIIRGCRPYLINRLPHSAQMALVKSSGFEIATELVYTPPRPSLPADMLRPHFALTTTPQDRITGMAFVVLRARSAKRNEA
jgi:hypothetical protein